MNHARLPIKLAALLLLCLSLAGCASIIAAAVKAEQAREEYDPKTYEYSVVATLTAQYQGRTIKSQSHYDLYSHHRCFGLVGGPRPPNTCFLLMGQPYIALSKSEFMTVYPMAPSKLFTGSARNEISFISRYSIEGGSEKEIACRRSNSRLAVDIELTLVRLSEPERNQPIDLWLLYPSLSRAPALDECLMALKAALDHTVFDDTDIESAPTGAARR